MEIKYSKKFKKNIRKLPKVIVDKFFERVEIFQEDKFNFILNNHKLNGKYKSCSSINVTGNYRAVFRYGLSNSIDFIDIGTHQELYE